MSLPVLGKSSSWHFGTIGDLNNESWSQDASIFVIYVPTKNPHRLPYSFLQLHLIHPIIFAIFERNHGSKWNHGMHGSNRT